MLFSQPAKEESSQFYEIERRETRAERESEARRLEKLKSTLRALTSQKLPGTHRPTALKNAR